MLQELDEEISGAIQRRIMVLDAIRAESRRVRDIATATGLTHGSVNAVLQALRRRKIIAYDSATGWRFAGTEIENAEPKVEIQSTRDRTLLLYLETCAVDRAGRVDARRVSAEDHEVIADWTAKGFVTFGRIKSAHHEGHETYYVRLSDAAWRATSDYRQERADRMWAARNYEVVEASV